LPAAVIRKKTPAGRLGLPPALTTWRENPSGRNIFLFGPAIRVEWRLRAPAAPTDRVCFDVFGFRSAAGFQTVPPAGRKVVAVIDNDAWMNIGISSGFQEFHATTDNGRHWFDHIERWRG